MMDIYAHFHVCFQQHFKIAGKSSNIEEVSYSFNSLVGNGSFKNLKKFKK